MKNILRGLLQAVNSNHLVRRAFKKPCENREEHPENPDTSRPI